jgi:hypothetical protein
MSVPKWLIIRQICVWNGRGTTVLSTAGYVLMESHWNRATILVTWTSTFHSKVAIELSKINKSLMLEGMGTFHTWKTSHKELMGTYHVKKANIKCQSVMIHRLYSELSELSAFGQCLTVRWNKCMESCC